jgi:hypothetical protein
METGTFVRIFFAIEPILTFVIPKMESLRTNYFTTFFLILIFYTILIYRHFGIISYLRDRRTLRRKYNMYL